MNGGLTISNDGMLEPLGQSQVLAYGYSDLCGPSANIPGDWNPCLKRLILLIRDLVRH